jgi:UMF1 family MFS transporter
VSPGSAVFYVITIATVLSFLAMPIVGALADRSSSKRRWLLGYALVGAVSAACLFFVTGTNWQLGALLMIIGNVALIASLTVFAAILVEIATPDERDRVSTHAWAFGYVGGLVLLIISLAIVELHDTFGLTSSMAVRICFLLAGVWWFAFSFVPYIGIKDRAVESQQAAVSFTGSFVQLRDTLRHVRGYPETLKFLIAFLFFNDGVQTVIAVAAVYGSQELGMSVTNVIIAVVVVQIMGIIGALIMTKQAERRGAYRVVLVALVLWTIVVIAGFFVPAHMFTAFVAMAAAIGLVVAGTQALSRSLFSQLIPRGREAEYFSLYQAAERGTSWLGTLVFGLVHQFTDSYRLALIALLIFFVIGGLLLRRVDMRRGITDAGNELPLVI